ncbi:hypothetical protein L226DRAFT_574867 [Lentinus tigrinus ALCF2SS1-7]|uniref:uncharacterized protein n=1 Tax=Lentinus tigrinus ALCF2SS1-7 TaxID=1328758 RepID=UPI001165F20C|nr:hypothetical protein L226DRAFT_574867 [Lentinus tigrinus ALCF2SS1-7]
MSESALIQPSSRKRPNSGSDHGADDKTVNVPGQGSIPQGQGPVNGLAPKKGKGEGMKGDASLPEDEVSSGPMDIEMTVGCLADRAAQSDAARSDDAQSDDDDDGQSDDGDDEQSDDHGDDGH